LGSFNNLIGIKFMQYAGYVQLCLKITGPRPNGFIIALHASFFTLLLNTIRAMAKSPDNDPIKAVIFDLDGVLVSTDEYHYKSWQQLADEEGIPFDREFGERFRGVCRMECLTMLLRRTTKDYTEEERQRLAERKNNYYRDMISHLSSEHMLPGSREMIHELRERGIKIGLASGSQNAPFIVERIDIGNELDAMVCGLDIDNSKPHPEIFLRAADELGIAPEYCLVVEDAQSGVEAARRAGMRALGISDSKLNGASQTISGFTEITPDELLNI
ncbi:MAG: beta-phosphoglucomutase, partial [Planctomycetota bacterium]